MGYSNNREFLPLTESMNFYSDGCGRTNESKYYVNGAYIDLCGLTPEEYMSNPCCGGGSGSGSGSGSDTDSSKTKNKIKVISYEENGMIYYQAIADYPVTSTVKIRVSNDETDTITELDIYVGETHSEPEVGESAVIKDATLDVKEDDEFEYIPTIKDEPEAPEDTMYNIYIETLRLDEVEGLTIEKIKSLPSYEMEDGTTIGMNYTIPATSVDVGEMEEDEFLQFCEENQYAFVLIMPKITYDNNAYAIFNYGGGDITNKFQYDSLYMIDGIDYVCLVEKAKDDIMPYVPLYNEDLVYEYKLTMKK